MVDINLVYTTVKKIDTDSVYTRVKIDRGLFCIKIKKKVNKGSV